MKLIKELPKSLLCGAYLTLMPASSLCSAKKEIVPVIVSLTSIPSRLPSLYIVIKSLFNQTHRPKKIILWLNDDLKDKLPARLSSLQSELFEIRYSALTCSHRKLVHSLKDFPDDVIITCDDDSIYDKHWLIKLFQQHQKYPTDVIANETRHIKIDAKGDYLSVNAWRDVDVNGKVNAFLPIGAWGILYPPHSLAADVFDVELFLRLTPKADDLWFKGMALLNGTNSRQSEDVPKEPVPIIGTQKIALKRENVKNNKNDPQWAALSQHFKLDRILLAD